MQCGISIQGTAVALCGECLLSNSWYMAYEVYEEEVQDRSVGGDGT